MKIGFVDHHLNNFHANKFLQLLRGPLAEEAAGARVEAAWESHPTGEDWCEKNGVRRPGSAAAVAAECDVVMVLAPDNIDAHLELCRAVFPAGKHTFVDKFLAPDRESARSIAALAREHGTAVFSASSLRFAVELVELQEAMREAGKPGEAFARGMGEWDGYGVHTLSLVLGAMGAEIARVIDTGTRESACVTLEYRDGRRAWLDVRSAANQWEALPWQFGLRAGDRYVTRTVTDYDGFYANLMRQALRFFRTGESPVSMDEMQTVVAVLERTAQSRSRGGEWLSLA